MLIHRQATTSPLDERLPSPLGESLPSPLDESLPSPLDERLPSPLDERLPSPLESPMKESKSKSNTFRCIDQPRTHYMCVQANVLASTYTKTTVVVFQNLDLSLLF